MKHLPLAVMLGLALPAIPSLAEDQAKDEIQIALNQIDPAITPEQYTAKDADLNGDGKMDALVLMNGQSGYCGSGGCTLFVFLNENDAFVPVGKMGVVSEPIYVRQEKTNGLAKLLVGVRGGGAKPILAELSFDGKSYPASPGDSASQAEETDTLVFADPVASFYDHTQKELQGLTFRVVSPNLPENNTVTISAEGLEGDQEPQTENLKGTVTSSEVADLDANGFPEVYVFVERAGGEPQGNEPLIYVSNKNKSITPAYLGGMPADAKAGYRGEDEFAVVENTLVQRFPIHDDAGNKTGKMRQVQYKLVPGEASWQLEADKTVEY